MGQLIAVTLGGLATLATVIVSFLVALAPLITLFPSPARINNPLSSEIENQLVSSVSPTLNSLESVVTWGFIALLAAAISGIQNEQKIKLGSFELEKQYAGVAILVALCGLEFQAMRLFQNLAYVLSQVVANSEQAKLALRTHPWFFNPFSENSGFISAFTDNLGFALLLILWWFGFHTSFFMLRGASLTARRIGIVLSLLYLLFGLVSTYMISTLIAQVNVETSLLKQIMLYSAIPIGAFGFGYLFKRMQNKSLQKVNNRNKRS